MGCSLFLLDPVQQYFEIIKQLVFLLINMHSSLQIPLALSGYCIGGKILEDTESEILNTVIQPQFPMTITANRNCLQKLVYSLQ